MAWVNVTSVYENTTMQQSVINGVASAYKISPVLGYVLHDKENDWTDYIVDEKTGLPTGETIEKLGFVTGSVTCGVDYDFEANPREFYAVPENTVPDNQIFGKNNEYEIM